MIRVLLQASVGFEVLVAGATMEVSVYQCDVDELSVAFQVEVGCEGRLANIAGLMRFFCVVLWFFWGVIGFDELNY